MKIDSVRVYSGVYEQGLDLSEYLGGVCSDIQIVYASGNFNKYLNSSLVAQVKKKKDFDALISIISEGKEYPIIMIEYSTAFPTDDHALQRFDCIFWSSVYKLISIKISPTLFNNKNNGGGTKIKIEHEQYAAQQLGTMYHHVEWKLCEDTNLVEVNDERVSCPIYNEEFHELLVDIFNQIKVAPTYKDFYSSRLEKYKKEAIKGSNVRDTFNNSSRFIFNSNKTHLQYKFNRFGHGLDPEKGGLVFWGTILERNVSIEFVVNRSKLTGKESYQSLFDGTPQETALNRMVRENYANRSNHFSPEFALEIFARGLSLTGVFENSIKDGNSILLDDMVLTEFLKICNSTQLILFSFSKEILLTDHNRNIIVTIKWNREIPEHYIQQLNTNESPMKPIPLQDLASIEHNEDWVTYATQFILRVCAFKIIAVSYPGAQGDRCVLTGSGRKSKRYFIDVVAVNKRKVLLQENKALLTNSHKDLAKLQEFIEDSEKILNLQGLLKISGINEPEGFEYNIGIGGQKNNDIAFHGIDYIMFFSICKERINYSIAIVNTTLFEVFKKITDKNNRLEGTIILPKNVKKIAI